MDTNLAQKSRTTAIPSKTDATITTALQQQRITLIPTVTETDDSLSNIFFPTDAQDEYAIPNDSDKIDRFKMMFNLHVHAVTEASVKQQPYVRASSDSKKQFIEGIPDLSEDNDTILEERIGLNVLKTLVG